jgi:hypothetical protein
MLDGVAVTKPTRALASSTLLAWLKPPFFPGCDPVTLAGAARLKSSRDCIAPARVAAPIFCPCARLADFRIDFGGTAAGHFIA